MRTTMRCGFAGTCALSVCALALAGALSTLSAQVTGEWEMAMDFGGRTTYATLSIAAKAGGTLTGTWGSAELSAVAFDGAKLTFARTIRMGEQEFTMTYTGTLKDGVLDGAFTTDRGTFAAKGTRPKPRCPAAGQWDLKYTMREREATARLSIVQKPDGSLEAAWKSERGEHAISGVKFEDGKLSFARTTTMGDRTFESTYEGTVKGDTLAGTIKSQMGEVPAGGQRVGAALIGKWELTTAGDQGPRTSTLRVFGDMTGRYELFGGEIPVKDLALDGDKVSFSVEMGFGDQTFKLDFAGTLAGKTLKGQLTSPRGTREVTGKKIDAAAALVGAWEFTRETPQGARTSTLTVKDDLTATYAVRDTTVPVADLRVEGDTVSFKVTMKFNDREVVMEFKGTLKGDTLAGELTTPRGTREAVGKKVAPKA